MPKRGATAIPNITMPVTTLPNATETALTADGLEFSDKEMTVKSRTDPLSLSGLCPLERSDVTSFMDFLKRVRPAGTTPDPASFAKQVQRYETMWVPFMKKHATTGARGDVCLCPPPDVHFAWIAHMLNPKAYEKDTQRVFGRVIDHNVADIEGKEKKTRPLWEAMFGPGSWGADHVPTKTEDRGAPLASCDLAAACKRQSGFWYQLSLPHHTEPAFLKESFARYRKFLLLTKTEPKLFSVPTYDIDLVWHCHQLHPLLYASETRRLLGTMLGHDDSVDDRSEGSKLINGWDATQAAWKAAYGESYAREGAMHRGRGVPRAPCRHRHPHVAAPGGGVLRAVLCEEHDVHVGHLEREQVRAGVRRGGDGGVAVGADSAMHGVHRHRDPHLGRRRRRRRVLVRPRAAAHPRARAAPGARGAVPRPGHQGRRGGGAGAVDRERELHLHGGGPAPGSEQHVLRLLGRRAGQQAAPARHVGNRGGPQERRGVVFVQEQEARRRAPRQPRGSAPCGCAGDGCGALGHSAGWQDGCADPVQGGGLDSGNTGKPRGQG